MITMANNKVKTDIKCLSINTGKCQAGWHVIDGKKQNRQISINVCVYRLACR